MLTPQREKKIQASGQKFLEAFARSFNINYGKKLLDEVAREAEGRKRSKELRKLKYRTWTSVRRPHMFEGFAWMKSGRGQGDFGSWRKFYFVERKDYNIDYYLNKEDVGHKKADGTILMAGYDIETRPREYYQKQWDILKADLNSAQERTEPVRYSGFAWALTHPLKTNYIFQLHEAKNPGFCSCFGSSAVEPDDMGAENENQRRMWLDFMDTCSERAKDRNHKGVKGKAFDATIKSVISKLASLKHFNGEGRESEVLVNIIMLHIVRPMKAEMLSEIKGSVKSKVNEYYKTEIAVITMVMKQVGPAWHQMQQHVASLETKLVPKLKESVTNIIRIKMAIKDKVKEKHIRKLRSLLDMYVTPFIQESVHYFDTPAQKGFDSVKLTFEVKVKDVKGDLNKIKIELDAIPRTGSNVKDIVSSTYALLRPFEDLKKAHPDIFGHINPKKLKAKAEKRMLKVLDACVYTLEKKMGTDDTTQYVEEHIVETIEDLDHDLQIERNRLVKDMITVVFIDGVKQLFFQQEQVSDIVNLIPPDAAEYLNIKNLLEELIEELLADPVDQMVDSLYPLPVDEPDYHSESSYL